MANVSDGWGTFVIDKVGNEFKEFIEAVDGDSAYYPLIDDSSFEVDSEGDAEFLFAAGGRWNYGSNLEGYLGGTWMNGNKEKEAYDKFVKALKEKNGSVTVSYKDCDTAMDWMGEGEFKLFVDEDGNVDFYDNFNEQRITLESFAEFQGETIEWAAGYLYGDEVVGEYQDYESECIKKGDEPVAINVWYDTIREEV